jgi:hypothetical protein
MPEDPHPLSQRQRRWDGPRHVTILVAPGLRSRTYSGARSASPFAGNHHRCALRALFLVGRSEARWLAMPRPPERKRSRTSRTPATQRCETHLAARNATKVATKLIAPDATPTMTLCSQTESQPLQIQPKLLRHRPVGSVALTGLPLVWV